MSTSPTVGTIIKDYEDSIIDTVLKIYEKFSFGGWLERQFNKLSFLTVTGQIIQAIVTFYMLYRLNHLAGVVTVLVGRLHNVEARENIVCVLPTSTEIIL